MQGSYSSSFLRGELCSSISCDSLCLSAVCLIEDSGADFHHEIVTPFFLNSAIAF